MDRTLCYTTVLGTGGQNNYSKKLYKNVRLFYVLVFFLSSKFLV